MTFISSSEVKKCIFHECFGTHEIYIFSLHSMEISHIHSKLLNLLYTSLSIEEMQILHLQGEV